MSVIVGVVDKGVVYLGADSQITQGGCKNNQYHPNNRKIWHPDEEVSVVMGSAGLVRGINITKNINGLIDAKTLRSQLVDFSYVSQHVVKNIMDQMETHKLLESKDFIPKMQNEYLIGYRDKLYKISVDGAVSEISEYEAIGSGQIEARSSLYTLNQDGPIHRIVKAIESAIGNDIYVSYPIVIINTKNKDVVVIQDEKEKNSLS
ncbi:Ntn hydrolase family protein [Mariniplasma anaerobium]|uniref:Uncharacterized protein n=1 Tax=Mariniplasma anaerobium TaxID=2735436 RepID=A0A7U9THB7_9MOLU|nr:hypothetical protein [Mariniplasma anaerobium]BCR35189.1 hypothetical protein MPAN_000820 [Mariniplasma anaerobium]